MTDGLAAFTAPTREWFTGVFDAPTAVQQEAWHAIARGDHSLVVAPTGSGKTLAAFLWAIDRLISQAAVPQPAGPRSGSAAPGAPAASAASAEAAAANDRSGSDLRRKASSASSKRRATTRVLYISPLKALGVDVERNLRSPLIGITQTARRMGLEPRIAFISYTTFGNPPGSHIDELRGAVKLLDGFHCDFEYEGEMGPDVALNYDMQQRFYPFSRLSGPANILVMPGLQSANLASKLLKDLGGESVLGPYILGLELPVQIAPMTATASDLVTLAVLAALGARNGRAKG